MPVYSKKRTTTKRPATKLVMSGKGAYTVRRKRISGQGAYTVDDGPWANRGASLGGAIGAHYGGPIGKAIGSWVGRRALHYPARLFGSGEYVRTDAGSELIAPQVPTFTKGSSDDSVVITHKEYLGDIITSDVAGGFKIQSYGLNPSEVNTFPWLSNLCFSNYQQFRFDGLAFEFKSFSADALNSTNTALGSVFACINYDYTDAALNSRYEVENTDWSSSCKPSEHMLVPVECKPRQTSMNGLLYVLNSNNVPANADPKTYYLGKLWFGTTGFQGTNVNIGSLYVTYKVRLYKPVMTRPLSNALMTITSRSGVTNTTRLGTATVPGLECDNIGVTFTDNTFTMSNKRLIVGQVYMLSAFWSGVSAADMSRANFSPVVSSAIEFVFYGKNGSTSFDEAPNGFPNTGVGAVGVNIYFRITNNTAPITFTTSLGNLPAAPAFLDFKLFQICGTPANQIGIYTPS